MRGSGGGSWGRGGVCRQRLLTKTIKCAKWKKGRRHPPSRCEITQSEEFVLPAAVATVTTKRWFSSLLPSIRSVTCGRWWFRGSMSSEPQDCWGLSKFIGACKIIISVVGLSGSHLFFFYIKINKYSISRLRLPYIIRYISIGLSRQIFSKVK